MRPFRGQTPAGLGLAALAAVVLALTGGSALAASGSGSSGSGSGGSGSSGSGGSGAVADFAFGANYNPPFFVGYVVRDGLFSCTACTTSYEPRYRVTGFTPGWDGNRLHFTSLNAFSGPVAVEVTGLPSGVSSDTATGVTVPRGGSTSTALRLRASSFALVGTATISVRASAGGKVHTIELPISIGDSLPAS